MSLLCVTFMKLILGIYFKAEPKNNKWLSLYSCSPVYCERQLVYSLNKSFHASGNFFFL